MMVLFQKRQSAGLLPYAQLKAVVDGVRFQEGQGWAGGVSGVGVSLIKFGAEASQGQS